MGEGSVLRAQPMLSELFPQTFPDRFGGFTASQKEGAAAQLCDCLARLRPENIAAQNMGWRDGLGCGGDHGLAGLAKR
jgi:hypothetical protein